MFEILKNVLTAICPPDILLILVLSSDSSIIAQNQSWVGGGVCAMWFLNLPAFLRLLGSISHWLTHLGKDSHIWLAEPLALTDMFPAKQLAKRSHWEACKGERMRARLFPVKWGHINLRSRVQEDYEWKHLITGLAAELMFSKYIWWQNIAKQNSDSFRDFSGTISDFCKSKFSLLLQRILKKNGGFLPVVHLMHFD